MLKNHKRKKIALLLALISISIVVIAFLFSDSIFFYNNKIIATVNQEKIFKKDIEEELSEIFPKNDPKTFNVEQLPKDVLELIVKNIFIKRELYKEAKKASVDKDQEVKNMIDIYSKKIIRERFLELEISKKVTKNAIQNKYLELSDAAKGGKEFLISHILVKTESEANMIVKKLHDKESFANLAKEYSLDKKNIGGNLGYLTKENMNPKFLEVIDHMKNNEISEPIKTNQGWQIIKLSNSRDIKLEDLEQVQGQIIENLKTEEMNKIFSDIVKDVKIKLFTEKDK